MPHIQLQMDDNSNNNAPPVLLPIKRKILPEYVGYIINIVTVIFIIITIIILVVIITDKESSKKIDASASAPTFSPIFMNRTSM